MKTCTLVFPRRDKKILLGKKKSRFGAGKWNGFGGKTDPEESLLEAAVRELREESGLITRQEQLEEVGVIDFYFDHDDSWNQRVHVYLVREWQGGPQETEEMLPKWFSERSLPYDNMWIDDQYWLPKALAGQEVFARFYFTQKGAEVVQMDFFSSRDELDAANVK